MTKQRKRVICIDSDPSFLTTQINKLKQNSLHHYLDSFSSFSEALQYIEDQIRNTHKKFHYILLDEGIIRNQFYHAIGRLSDFNAFLRKPEIIVYTQKNDSELRNKIMQFPPY